MTNTHLVFTLMSIRAFSLPLFNSKSENTSSFIDLTELKNSDINLYLYILKKDGRNSLLNCIE